MTRDTGGGGKGNFDKRDSRGKASLLCEEGIRVGGGEVWRRSAED